VRVKKIVKGVVDYKASSQLLKGEGAETSLDRILEKWGNLGRLNKLHVFERKRLKRKKVLERILAQSTLYCYYRETASNVFVSIGRPGSGSRSLVLTRSLFQVGGKLDKFKRKAKELGDKIAESVVRGLKEEDVARFIVVVRSCAFWGKSRRLRVFLAGMEQRGMVITRVILRASRPHNGCRARKLRRM